MLASGGWGMLYPDRRGASTAGSAPTIVERAMWEVKRGAWGVRRAASGTRGIVPNCSPAGLTRCAAKRRKFAASGGGNARERANLKAPKVSSRHPPGSHCFGTMPYSLTHVIQKSRHADLLCRSACRLIQFFLTFRIVESENGLRSVIL